MPLMRKDANPAALTWTTLYTTGPAEELVLSSATASNTSSTAPASVYVYVRPSAEARGIKHSLIYLVALQPVSAANVHRVSIVEGVCVPPNWVVECYASTADCVFAINGEVVAV